MKPYASYLIFFLCLASIGAYFLISSDSGAGKDFLALFDSKFEAYPNVLTRSRSDDAGANKELLDIMQLYENAQYGQAAGQITLYLKAHKDETQLKLYRGICYLETNETGKAEEDFKDVMLSNEELVDQAEWYLALTGLKAKKVNEAREWFTKIAAKNNGYSPKAQDALAGLQEIKEDEMLKLYEMNDDGRGVFFYANDENPVPHFVTDRTLYLEASRKNIISADIGYNDFVKLSIPEKQEILKSGQQNTYAKVDKGMLDLYASAMAFLPKPALTVPEIETPQELSAVGAAEISAAVVVDSIADQLIEDSLAAQPEPPVEQTAQKEQELPWIIDILLRAERGKELKDDPIARQENTSNEIPFVVEVITNSETATMPPTVL